LAIFRTVIHWQNRAFCAKALTPPGCRAQTAYHAPNDTLASCTPPNAHILNPHTGKCPARIRPLLPSQYHPLPSLIGPATAAALTNTRAHAHAHLYHHLHSRFAYPSQGHPPCRHMHQLPPLLGLPSSSTTTPPSQSQTYPLAAQQRHWPWELRGTGKVNPRTRLRREVRLLLLRRVSTATLER